VSVGEEITGAFPSFRVARGGTPRPANELASASQELHIEGSVVKGDTVTVIQQGIVFFTGFLPGEKSITVYSLIVKGRRGHKPVDPELAQQYEQFAYLFEVGILIECCIDENPEAPLLGLPDGGYRFFENSVLTGKPIMCSGHPIEVENKMQIGGRRKTIEIGIEEKTVGTQVNELFASHNLFDDLGYTRMDERLTAGNAYYRCTTLFDRLYAFCKRKLLVEDVSILSHPSTPHTIQITPEGGLEHQYKRILALPFGFFAEQIQAQSS
jgi:hypothetical protein